MSSFSFRYKERIELDSIAFCRYQSPLPADQVKPSAEFEYEGGNLKIKYHLSLLGAPSCSQCLIYNVEGSPAGRGRGNGRGRGRARGKYASILYGSSVLNS